MIRIAKTGNQVLGGVEEFEWSSAEQVWPFEKTESGETLYCRLYDCGAMPNNGFKSVALNIANLDRIYRQDFEWGDSGFGWMANNYPSGASYVNQYINSTKVNIVIGTNFSFNLGTGKLRLIYTKSA